MPSREERIQNLKKANEESHRVIVDSLREAMYDLLETNEISEIRVVDLIRRAGVSRGAFYKNFYQVTDVLKQFLGDFPVELVVFHHNDPDLISFLYYACLRGLIEYR